MMRIKKSFALLVVFIIMFLVHISEARRGYCSHHGGVCGCECCDGSPLSAKCAPYYPDCGRTRINNTNRIQKHDNQEIQRRLKELGYYNGSIDGILGSGSRNAIRRFQSDMNLTVTGTINNETRQALEVEVSRQ